MQELPGSTVVLVVSLQTAEVLAALEGPHAGALDMLVGRARAVVVADIVVGVATAPVHQTPPSDLDSTHWVALRSSCPPSSRAPDNPRYVGVGALAAAFPPFPSPAMSWSAYDRIPCLHPLRSSWFESGLEEGPQRCSKRPHRAGCSVHGHTQVAHCLRSLDFADSLPCYL